jgi:hypothetical protein
MQALQVSASSAPPRPAAHQAHTQPVLLLVQVLPQQLEQT